MTTLFEYLHTLQSIWVANLEYQVKQGWLWLDPLLSLLRDYFFETTVVVTVIILYTIIFSAISFYSQQPQDKKITYTDEFKSLVKGIDLHLGEDSKKSSAKIKPTKTEE
jgi:hypothetical protein